MKKFTCVQDIGNLKSALDEAFEIKKDRFKYVSKSRRTASNTWNWDATRRS